MMRLLIDHNKLVVESKTWVKSFHVDGFGVKVNRIGFWLRWRKNVFK